MDKQNSGCACFQRFKVVTVMPKKSARSKSIAPSRHSFSAWFTNSGLNLVGRPRRRWSGSSALELRSAFFWLIHISDIAAPQHQKGSVHQSNHHLVEKRLR